MSDLILLKEGIADFICGLKILLQFMKKPLIAVSDMCQILHWVFYTFIFMKIQLISVDK